MSVTISTLLEKDQIIEIVTKLFVFTDQLNWPEVLKCFAGEVFFDQQSLTGEEPMLMDSNDIVDAWDAGLKPLDAVHHQVGNFIVDIESDTADVFCYGIASHYLPNKSNENTRVFVGSYDFHLTRESGSWTIDKFRFNLKYIDGNPNLEEAAKIN
jgi:hypothetical protein